MPKEKEWDKHWLEHAKVTAHLSKDPNTKVGAIIVSPDNRQCSIGYNGFAVGVNERKELWERPLKYQYVIHAEENAILNCPFETKGTVVYVTLMPCHFCLARLRNAQVQKIIFETFRPISLENAQIWLDNAEPFGLENIYRYDDNGQKVFYKTVADLTT